MAAGHYRTVEPPGDPDFDGYLRDQLVKRGAMPASETWPSSYPRGIGESITATLGRARDDVVRELVNLGFDRRKLDRVTVGPTFSSDFTARVRRWPDDSALVLVSDSMLTVCGSYSIYLGRALGGPNMGWVRMFFRTMRAAARGRLSADPTALTGALRFHNVIRRVFGLAAVPNFTGPVHGLDVGEGMLEHALRFTIGHELAHHVLGHDGEGHCAFSVDESIVASSDAEEREATADVLSLLATGEATVRFVEEELFTDGGAFGRSPTVIPRHRREGAEFISLVGALISMVAVSSLERALFVRRGRTHLPAEVRASVLVNNMLGDARLRSLEGVIGEDWRVSDRFEIDRSTVSIFMHDLLLATEQASSFTDGHAFDWTPLSRGRGVVAPPPELLRRVAALDAVMCASDTALVDRIATTVGSRCPAANEGTMFAVCGCPAEALETWDVPASDIAAIQAPDRALSFHTLVEALRGRSVFAAAPLEVAVAAATLLSRH